MQAIDLYQEISKLAHDLYEKSGRIEGRDLDNWLEAERIVKERLAIKGKSGIQKIAPDKKESNRKGTKKSAPASGKNYKYS
ncbi:MAG: DUF2934 domain-containing protein [Nitrospirota bacterium]